MTANIGIRRNFGKITTKEDKRDSKINWSMDENFTSITQYQEDTNQLLWHVESPRFKATPFISDVFGTNKKESEFCLRWSVSYRIFAPEETNYKFKLNLYSVINNVYDNCISDYAVKVSINFVDANARIVFGFLRQLEREDLVSFRFEASKTDVVKWGLMSTSTRELRFTMKKTKDQCLEDSYSDQATFEMGIPRSSTPYTRTRPSPSSATPEDDVAEIQVQGLNRSQKRRRLESRLPDYQPCKKLYQEMKYTDLTLKTGSIEIECHKGMLASVSNVLDESLQDTDPNEVLDVSDHLPEDIARHFVEYIYTGKLVEDLDLESRIKMYDAAKFYAIESLVDRVIAGCGNLLNVETAIKGFKLAIDSGCESLKERALTIIYENKKKVTETQDYRDMTSELSRELVTAVLLFES